jgi:hypothetical protein
MGTVCDGNTHYDRFRRCTHRERPDLRPDGGIRIRRQLDPDGMGHLAGPSTGVTQRGVGRAIGPAARLLLRNASV